MANITLRKERCISAMICIVNVVNSELRDEAQLFIPLPFPSRVPV